MPAKPESGKTGAKDIDLAGIGRGGGQGDLKGIRRQQGFNPRGPFDDHQTMLLEQFFKSDGLEVRRAGDAVGVEMENGAAGGGIEVQQDVGGTADGPFVAAIGADQAPDELGFAGAQVAMQGEAIARPKGGGQIGGDLFGLGNGMGRKGG